MFRRVFMQTLPFLFGGSSSTFGQQLPNAGQLGRRRDTARAGPANTAADRAWHAELTKLLAAQQKVTSPYDFTDLAVSRIREEILRNGSTRFDGPEAQSARTWLWQIRSHWQKHGGRETLVMMRPGGGAAWNTASELKTMGIALLPTTVQPVRLSAAGQNLSANSVRQLTTRMQVDLGALAVLGAPGDKTPSIEAFYAQCRKEAAAEPSLAIVLDERGPAPSDAKLTGDFLQSLDALLASGHYKSVLLIGPPLDPNRAVFLDFSRRVIRQHKLPLAHGTDYGLPPLLKHDTIKAAL